MSANTNLASHRTIVIGVDESDSSRTAQAWALAEARRRGLALRLVRAYTWGPATALPAYTAGVPVDAMNALKREAEDAIVAVLDELRQQADGVPVSSVAIEGDPADVLLMEAANAFELVVGSRHLKATGGFFLGSVGAKVAAKATCPVTVVRGPAGIPGEHPHIVAAVDGSARSEDVLAFAFEEASRAGLPLQVLTCWLPAPAGLSALLDNATLRSHQEAEIHLSEVVAGWREKFPDVTVTESVVEGHAVPVLVEKSYGQSLLVIGRGSKHSRLGTLFGSTSQGILHHATCPVTVVGAP